MALRDDITVPIAPAAPGVVLTTMNDDGSRRWLRPRVSRGRFLTARRIVAYALIAVFTLLPIIHIHGKPVVLIDILARRLHLLGYTFYPTDTLLLALLVVGAFVTVFWVTALLGRVWCGWACPQTVYLEFVFRPLERFFEGAPGRSPKGLLQTSGAGTVLKFVVYFACAFFLAHTFLAYFVSWNNLSHWVLGSPGTHPVGFFVVMLVTAAMLFNFGYFREQVCLVACPYGRFQSVMLDRASLIIRYDAKRGEPRGKRAGRADVHLPIASQSVGDCVDCSMCVTTCPTGIDIRKGLQMECVACAQCIDACDAVMDKLQRPRGLIRYSSEVAAAEGHTRILRPRVVIYPLILMVIGSAFTFVLLNTGVADITLTRGLGQPFSLTSEGEVSNPARIKIVNRSDFAAAFTIGLSGTPNARILTDSAPLTLAPGEARTVPAQIIAPASAFTNGPAAVSVIVTGPERFSYSQSFSLLGPSRLGPASTDVQR